MRLLREKWRSATLLAEELYAMFQDKIPLTHRAPLTIRHDGPGAALRVTNPSGPSSTFDGSMSITRGGVTISNPQGPAITIDNYRAGDDLIRVRDPAGGEVGCLFSDGVNLFWNCTEPTPISGGGGGSGAGNAFPGTVVSGSGSTYQVSIETQTGTQTVTVTQMQIAGGETIPAGTPAVVVQVGAAYKMQVPVWLA